MKRLLLVSVLCIAGFSHAGAQIITDIKGYVDSTEILFVNARKMIVQNLLRNELQRASELFVFLKDSAQNQQCTAFTYEEELYIYTLLKDWQSLKKHIDRIQELKKRNLCYSFPANLELRLKTLIAERYAELLSHMNNEKLEAETTALIDMYLYITMTGKMDDMYAGKRKQFHKLYPDSESKHFTKEFLPETYIKGGMGASIGTISYLPLQMLSEYLTPNLGFAYSLDFFVNKLYFSAAVGISPLNLKKELPSSFMQAYPNVTLPNKKEFTMLDVNLSAGYNILKNRKLKLIPYISTGMLSISTDMYQYGKEFDELVLVATGYAGPGLLFYLQLWEKKQNNRHLYSAYPYPPDEWNTIGFHLQAGYNYLFDKTPEMKGDISYVKLGLTFTMATR
jgi:hypothetical protein